MKPHSLKIPITDIFVIQYHYTTVFPLLQPEKHAKTA